MTTHSTFYTCEICPNYDEPNNKSAYWDLGSRPIETDVEGGAP